MSDTLTEAIRFQRDLYLYWHEVVTAGGLQLNTRGYLARAAMRRVSRRLAGVDGLSLERMEGVESEQMRLFYLRRLLQRLRLLERTQTTPAAAILAAAPPSEMSRYLAHTLPERLRISARVWVAGGWWPDRQNPQTPPPRLMLPAPPRVALARQRLLDELSFPIQPDQAARLSAPPTQPPSIAKEMDRAGRRRPTLRHSGGGATAEEEIRQDALAGPLLWMGFVEVQEDVDDVQERPRMPPGGAESVQRTYRPTSAILALHQEREGSVPDFPDARRALTEVHGRIVIQPNFEIVAFPPLTGPMLALLHACAEEVALERTARFRLTRGAFAEARRRRWSATALIQRLESEAGAPLPENVRVTLADWERQAERLRVTPNVRLLEVRESPLLDALLADPTMAHHIRKRITSVAAVVSTEGVADVRAWLLRHGELPAIKDQKDQKDKGANGSPAASSSDG